jgi:hypothetical protein
MSLRSSGLQFRTNGNIPRRDLRPSDASLVTLFKTEGAGNTGCWPHPRALRAKKVHFCARKQRQGSRDNRRSLRNGFTAYT